MTTHPQQCSQYNNTHENCWLEAVEGNYWLEVGEQNGYLKGGVGGGLEAGEGVGNCWLEAGENSWLKVWEGEN